MAAKVDAADRLDGSVEAVCSYSNSPALEQEEEHSHISETDSYLKVLLPSSSDQGVRTGTLGPIKPVTSKVKHSGQGGNSGDHSSGEPPGPYNHKLKTDIDAVVVKLASEATDEVKRLRAVNGLAVEETRKHVWRVLRLFRSMVLDQSELRGKIGGTLDNPDPENATLSNKVNHSELNARLLKHYTTAKAQLEDSSSSSEDLSTRKIVGKFMEMCIEEQESSSGRLNSSSVCILLHRTSSLLSYTSPQTREWAIKHYEKYFKNLLIEVNRRLGLFDPQGYAVLIWSFGKLGSELNSFTVGPKSFTTLVKDLLQAARQSLNRFTINDSLNIILGLVGLNLPQEIYAVFLRGLTKTFSSKLGDCSPHDILSLLWALAKLEYLSSSDLIVQMCQTVEKRLDEFTVLQIASFMRGIPTMEHKGVASLTQKVCKEMEAKVDELDLSSTSKLVWALLYLAVHPGEVLMCRLGNLLAAESSQTLTPQLVMYSVLALAHRGQTHGPGIEAAKAHFINNSSAYSSPDTSKFIWALAMMDALDVDLLNAVGNSPYGLLKNDQRWVDDRLHLSQVLISWRILNGQSSPEFITHETEEACYKAWKDVQRARTAIGLVPEVIKLLSSAGFVCRSQQLIENVPLSITSAVKERTGATEGLNLSVEVRTRSQAYSNYPQLQKPRQRWRQRVLEASGWTVLQVPVDKWNRLPNYDAKTTFLRQAIYAKTSVAVQFPEKYDRYNNTEGSSSSRAPVYSSTGRSQMGLRESDNPPSTLHPSDDDTDSTEIAETTSHPDDSALPLGNSSDSGTQAQEGSEGIHQLNEEEAMLEEMGDDLAVKGLAS